jgi:hypothetical protein
MAMMSIPKIWEATSNVMSWRGMILVSGKD